jgi:hypothetical protein
MPKFSSAEKKAEWEARICQQRESGLSIEKWCRQNQLAPHTFHYWKDLLFPKSQLTRSSFVELPIAHGTGISIEYRGIRIFIAKSFDPVTLRSCLAALQGIQC